MTAEPTPAAVKRTAARRVFAEKAGWLRCSAVGDRCGYPPLSRLAIRPFPRKQDSHGISKQALKGCRVKAVTSKTPSPQSKRLRIARHASNFREVLDCGDRVEGQSPLWIECGSHSVVCKSNGLPESKR